jgi:hypothetical protein
MTQSPILSSVLIVVWAVSFVIAGWVYCIYIVSDTRYAMDILFNDAASSSDDITMDDRMVPYRVVDQDVSEVLIAEVKWSEAIRSTSQTSDNYETTRRNIV